ncbi:hypothetical protein V499_09500 [Pseudogymnoascus sp. VKM F-103]|nr:hypothetical protein V499_09500 [Pseudogymnoascus sp. VKM F-103]
MCLTKLTASAPSISPGGPTRTPTKEDGPEEETSDEDGVLTASPPSISPGGPARTPTKEDDSEAETSDEET